MSDDLIDRLATDLAPVPGSALAWRLLAALASGAAIAVLVMIFGMGLRADLAGALSTATFWIKFGYTGLLALGGFLALERLARPGGTARSQFVAIAFVVAGCAVLAMAQLASAGPGESSLLIWGGTALICPFLIVLLAAPVFAVVIAVLRRLAPTNLTLGGLAAGLLAGSAGAWVYAFHCGENGMPFLALWYTLGVAVCAALGALTGRWLLRW